MGVFMGVKNRRLKAWIVHSLVKRFLMASLMLHTLIISDRRILSKSLSFVMSIALV